MGLRKKLDNFFSSLVDNKTSYQLYYDTIKELCITRFEWKNIPDEIDVRFLELMLFERGAVVWFYDDVLEQYICLPYALREGFTIYRKPVAMQAFAVNGAKWDLSNKNAVVIYNNTLRTPNILFAETYAKRLSQMDRTIDVNIHAQMTPVLIRCDERERLSIQNLYMKYDGGQPVIYGDKNLSSQPLQAISTEAPFVSDKIYDLKVKFWNEMLTKLGIPNVAYQKKERMVSDEVQRSQGGTVAERYSGLLMRQQACDEINKMFGLDISVEYRSDIDGKLDLHETIADVREEEGEE